MNDVATLMAAGAAFTTIVYNVQKMIKDKKSKNQ
jgi:hypothetical protein